MPRVRFLGEQNGPAEQSLKDRLAELFKRDRSVLTAYLAHVDVCGQTSVALCLMTQFGPDRSLIEKIGVVFKTTFNAEVHLDIMFPNASQEAELKQVCRPFFVAVPPPVSPRCCREALVENPRLEAASRGNRINAFFKETVGPALQHLLLNGTRTRRNPGCSETAPRCLRSDAE